MIAQGINDDNGELSAVRKAAVHLRMKAAWFSRLTSQKTWLQRIKSKVRSPISAVSK